MKLEIVINGQRSTVAAFEQSHQIGVMQAAAVFLRSLPGRTDAMQITQEGQPRFECAPPYFIWKKIA